MLYPPIEIQPTSRATDVAILWLHNASRTHCVSVRGCWVPSMGRLRAVRATVASDRPTTHKRRICVGKSVSQLGNTLFSNHGGQSIIREDVSSIHTRSSPVDSIFTAKNINKFMFQISVQDYTYFRNWLPGVITGLTSTIFKKIDAPQ